MIASHSFVPCVLSVLKCSTSTLHSAGVLVRLEINLGLLWMRGTEFQRETWCSAVFQRRSECVFKSAHYHHSNMVGLTQALCPPLAPIPLFNLHAGTRRTDHSQLDQCQLLHRSRAANKNHLALSHCSSFLMNAQKIHISGTHITLFFNRETVLLLFWHDFLKFTDVIYTPRGNVCTILHCISTNMW